MVRLGKELAIVEVPAHKFPQILRARREHSPGVGIREFGVKCVMFGQLSNPVGV